jgi:methylated-DNA-protein-cysteine methyltransferase related protein
MRPRDLFAPGRRRADSKPTRARSDAPPPFHRLVYRVVRRVPRGKVVTYGQVAAILGRPRGARAVGKALGALREAGLDAVPWQRVIGAAGRCTHRDGFRAEVQRDLLEGEGVRFDRTGRVDLERTRWRGPPRTWTARLRAAYSGPDTSVSSAPPSRR